jgi:hypothetical protein
MKYIITESRINQIAMKWLNDNYGDLEPFETKKYYRSIFYRKGDDIIFEYDNRDGYKIVYISYDEIWSFLKSMFNMEYEQIQDLTKEWIEERYNLMVTSTFDDGLIYQGRWRDVTN